jgi:(E)-4-hydroxy-3-methyl-but-2-enyl pyrophosphate reductase
MKVKLAKSAGYCMGVIRAMDLTLKVARSADETIYTYGPLIHNPQVIDMLKKLDVHQIKDLDEEGKNRKLMIRAHGIPPDKMEEIIEKGYDIKDATCPKVARVQNLIKKYANDGFTIIIAGDEGHAEVIGLLGFARGKGIVVKNVDDINRLSVFDKVLVVAQTTFNEDQFSKIGIAAKSKYEHAEVFDTICDSTSRRQNEVRELAKIVDAMVIVGGKESANTKRLAEVSKETGIPTLSVETDEELIGLGLEEFKIVGVTAGASTPNWMISRVVDTLETIRPKGKPQLFSRIYEGIIFIGKSNILVAIGASAMYYTSAALQRAPLRLSNLLIAFLYVYAMHILNQFTDREASEINDPAKVKFYQKYRSFLITSGILSIAIALIGGWNLGFLSFILLAVSSLLGLAYRVQLIPIKSTKRFKFLKLEDIPASKNIFVALAWATVLVIIPALNINAVRRIEPGLIIAFIFIFIIVFMRAVLFDLWGIQGDMILGKETIPIILGEKKTKKFLIYLSLLLSVILVISSLLSLTSSLGYYLLFIIFYFTIHLFLSRLTIISKKVVYELLVDSTFLLSGLVTLFYKLHWII